MEPPGMGQRCLHVYQSASGSDLMCNNEGIEKLKEAVADICRGPGDPGPGLHGPKPGFSTTVQYTALFFVHLPSHSRSSCGSLRHNKKEQKTYGDYCN